MESVHGRLQYFWQRYYKIKVNTTFFVNNHILRVLPPWRSSLVIQVEDFGVSR